MDLKIDLAITERNGVYRFNEPMTIGLPFKKGIVWENTELILINGKEELIPFQTIISGYWPDHSVKWLLLDFQATLKENEEVHYYLVINTGSIKQFNGITVSKQTDFWEVDTGGRSYHVDSKIFKPFNRVLVNGKDVIAENCSKIEISDNSNAKYVPEISSMSIELSGSLRTVLKFDGVFGGNNKPYASFSSRVHFFSNKSFVKIDFTLWNPNCAKHPSGLWDLGDHNSIFFRDLSFYIIPLLNKENVKNVKIHLSSKKTITTDNQKKIVAYQDSSGGENWKSPNHINREGIVPLKHKGYHVKRDGEIIDEGLRTNPILYFETGNCTGLSCCIQKYWQNFPKALEIDENLMIMRIFPKYFSDLHELQPGERKTHTLFIDFSNDSDRLLWTQHPLLPRISSDYYSETKAVPYLNPGSIDQDTRYSSLINASINGKYAFNMQKEVIDEYGWRNYGDIYANHEAVGYKGQTPLVSHYNNQYDLLYSFIRQYLSTGNIEWYNLHDDLARHIIDIDIYHTKSDRDEYNGGFFWHTDHYLDAGSSTHRSQSKEHLKVRNPKFCGGGPGLEHNYTTGLLFNYYVTGNIASKEAVLEIAEWVSRNIDFPNTILATLYSIRNEFLNIKKVIMGEKLSPFQYPLTRGSGNSINTFLDAYDLTSNHDYIKKIEVIIQGCLHPKECIAHRNLLDAESNWSYTVLLHSIGKYLDKKTEIQQFDSMFAYARDCLITFGKWMLENEYPYLEKPEILEFPNETWPAQDLRKSIIFCYAAKYSKGEAKKALLEKAVAFYNESIDSINTFETKAFARPLALVLQSGTIYHSLIDSSEENETENIQELNCLKFDNFLTIKMIVDRSIKKLRKAAKTTSIKKEIKWIKNRVYPYL